MDDIDIDIACSVLAGWTNPLLMDDIDTDIGIGCIGGADIDRGKERRHWGIAANWFPSHFIIKKNLFPSHFII